ncbi:MAG: glutathione transferase GstA [Myxococcota bacterium]
MKLYYAPHTCALSPHILLHELGLPFELERVDLRSKRTETGQDYATINPKGYVPTLELDDGSRLTEGPAISQYLGDQVPERGLVPPAGSRERYELQSWLNFISCEVHKPFGALFGSLPEEQKEAQRAKIIQRLDWVESELERRPWLVGDQYGAADIYLFVITGWADGFGLDTRHWPHLREWRARIAERPAVKAAIAEEEARVEEKV